MDETLFLNVFLPMKIKTLEGLTLLTYKQSSDLGCNFYNCLSSTNLRENPIGILQDVQPTAGLNTYPVDPEPPELLTQVVKL